MKKLIVIIGTITFVLIASFTVSAHHMSQYQGMGPGMMGPGMMGPGMMGPGMMGPGMMGGGMNRLMAINYLSLSDDQQSEINKIRTDLRKANWDLKGEMMDHRDKLIELYRADSRDTDAIVNVYSEMFKLKQQMLKNALDADNKAYALLDDEQREQLKKGANPSGPMRRGMHHRHGMMN